MAVMKDRRLVTRELAERALEGTLSPEGGGKRLSGEDLSWNDELNLINDLLADLHLRILSTGEASTTEAKNFRYFVKKAFQRVVDGPPPGEDRDGDAGALMSEIVWNGFRDYVENKLESLEEMKRKRKDRIDRILSRRRHP